MTTTATRQPTLKQLHAAAIKRFGKSAFVSHNPKAPSADERVQMIAANKLSRARIDEITAELERMKDRELPGKLLAAAQFVCDVSGDEPSIDQLRVAVNATEHAESLREEKDRLTQQIRTSGTYAYRWRAGYERSWPFPCRHIEEEADTAEALMRKIESESK